MANGMGYQEARFTFWFNVRSSWTSIISTRPRAHHISTANNTILTIVNGTIDITHLEVNVQTIEKPPLPIEKQTRLHELFGHLSTSIGNQADSVTVRVIVVWTSQMLGVALKLWAP